MQLRPYQSTAIEALYAWLTVNAGNPVVVAPTGSGKSLLIAKVCQDAVSEGGRVLVLQHVKELIEQNAEKIRTLCPDIHIGIYSVRG
jgi:DNA repair protein RadD